MNGTIILSNGQEHPVSNVGFGALPFEGSIRRTVHFETAGTNTMFILHDQGQVLRVGNRVLQVAARESDGQTMGMFGSNVTITMFLNGSSIDQNILESQIITMLEDRPDNSITDTDDGWCVRLDLEADEYDIVQKALCSLREKGVISGCREEDGQINSVRLIKC